MLTSMTIYNQVKGCHHEMVTPELLYQTDGTSELCLETTSCDPAIVVIYSDRGDGGNKSLLLQGYGYPVDDACFRRWSDAEI